MTGLAITALQAGIDISVPQTTVEQRILAYIVIGVAALAVAYGLYRTHYTGLPKSLKRAKADLRGARADTTLTTTYLDAEAAADPGEVRAAVDAVLDRTADDPTTRDAANSIREELAKTWVPKLEGIPRIARRIAGLALVVLVFGAIAVSTEAFVRVMTASTPGVQPLRWPILAVTQTAAVIGQAGDAISTVPVIGTLWSLGFALAILVWEWLFTHYYVVALALAGGAAGLTWLDRELEGAADAQWVDDLPEPGRVARLGAGTVAGLWGITLVGVGMGRMAGPPSLGVRYGLVAAATAFAVFLILGIAGLVRFRESLPTLRWRSLDTRTRQYLAVRGATLGLAAIIGPLVPVWVGIGLTKLPTLVGAFLAADAPIKAVVLLVGFGAVAAIASQAREAWGDVRQALTITAARQEVRGSVVASGVPIAVVGTTYVLVSGLTKSILLGVVFAVLSGLLARTAVQWLTRVRFKATRMAGGDPTPARRVVIEGAPLETRGGARQDYLRINGSTELLYPDRDELASDAVAVAGGLVEEGDAPATVSEWHARFAFDVGVTDPDETAMKLYSRAAKRVYHAGREHGPMLPREHIDEEIGDLPDSVARLDGADAFFDREERHSNIRIRDDYVEILDDPRRRISS